MPGDFTTRDGARLWSAVDGVGPPVVLCHGGPGLWDYLGGLAGLLSDDFTVYRWDQRECGRSTAGSEPMSMRRVLADLDELREHLGHDRWAVVGHSWGAEIALMYGLLYEGRSSRVACVSGTGARQWWRTVGRLQYHANRDALRTAEQAARLTALAALPRRSDDEEREFRRLSWMTDFLDPGGAAALTEMVDAPFEINFAVNRSLVADDLLDDAALRERAGTCRVPMLFLHGAGDPRPAAGPRELAGLIRSATFELIHDAGHLPWVEQPDLVRTRLKQFLQAG